MAEDIDLTGLCPTIANEERVSPVFDEDKGVYICDDCGRHLGEDAATAEDAFQSHALKVRT